MAERNDQQVATADRVPVPEGIAQFIPGDNILGDRIAERAFYRFHSSNPRVLRSGDSIMNKYPSTLFSFLFTPGKRGASPRRLGAEPR
jgi:hypothetical protein